MSDKCSQFQSDESQRQLEEQQLQTRMERIGQKILILSGKGGVGKSTMAANLAMSLASAGKKVGLLDVDLHGPSIPKIVGLEGRRLETNAAGSIVPIAVTETLSVVSVGLLLGSDTDAVIWRGPMKYNVIRQFLKDVAWGELDYLVIDSPPGTGDEPLAVAQMVGAGALAVVVTTPQDVAIADVRRSVSFCHTLNLPIAGIVENMSGMICPHCGERVDLFKSGGGEALAQEMGAAFLGRIPLDPQIVLSGDSGRPFVQGFADSPTAKAFAEVVAPILNREEAKSVPVAAITGGAKIAIPTAGGELCMHFGHCQQFAMVQMDETGRTIDGVEFLTPPPHEPGVLPKWLREQGATTIIAGGMGQRAQGLFADNGIQVVVGVAAGGTPEAVVTAFVNQTLEVGDNVCDH